MYKDFTQALNTASSDNTVKAALITGAGKYYSSGNDITNFSKALGPDTTPQQVAAESRDLLRYTTYYVPYSRKFLETYHSHTSEINFRKPSTITNL